MVERKSDKCCYPPIDTIVASSIASSYCGKKMNQQRSALAKSQRKHILFSKNRCHFRFLTFYQHQQFLFFKEGYLKNTDYADVHEKAVFCTV